MDRIGCYGTSIKTASGYIDLMDPDPYAIDLKTIAAALSKLCRYGGQCPRFYSVAEHCFHCWDLARQSGYRQRTWILQMVLLHDAAEAYLGDVIKPIKVLLPGYNELEERMQSAIAHRFGLDFIGQGEIIKRIDSAILRLEKESMWPDDQEQWEGLDDTTPTGGIRLYYWTPEEAEVWFLNVAGALGLN